MKTASVLICGAGIAGPALACELLRYGFKPTLLERAPRLRDTGYIVDFWGKGFDLVEQLGLLPELRQAGYQVREVRILNERGRRVGGFGTEVFHAATAGRFTSLLRSDLSALLFRACKGRVQTLFDDSIVALEPRADQVQVRFERAPSRAFDLVIGADGLHSRVRELAFGPEPQFERFLGYSVAAFQVAGYRPRDEDVYVAYSEPGRLVARFTMRGDRTMFLFVARDAGVTPIDLREPRRYLCEHFGSLGWECPRILDALAACDEIYLDRVSQICMPHWSKGRVCLIGDAAAAPSLLAGQGSALAVMQAHVLAGELARASDHAQAFERYEQLLLPFVSEKQRAAVGFAGAFAPETRLGLTFRNVVSRLVNVPPVARLALGSALRDRLDIPDYTPYRRAEMPSDQAVR